MADFHVVAGWVALLLVVPAIWGTLFTLRVEKDFRFIFVFLITLGLWGVARMSFWDLLPTLVDLEHWADFSAIFHGSTINGFLNSCMAFVSAVHLWHLQKIERK